MWRGSIRPWRSLHECVLQQFVWEEEEEGGVSVMLRGEVKDACFFA